MRKHRLVRQVRAYALQRAVPVLGVGWYTEAEWSSVKSAAADPELFERSFGEWVAMAEEALTRLRIAGTEPRKILVTSSELLAWCIAHGKTNNAASRAQFVSEKVRAQSRRDA